MIKKKRLRKNADKHEQLENTFQDIETWLDSITDENIPYSEEYNGVDSHLWKSICLSQVIIEITVLRPMLPEDKEDDVDPVEWDITLICNNVGSQMSSPYNTKTDVEDAVARLKEIFEYNYHIDYENCVKYFLDSYQKTPMQV